MTDLKQRMIEDMQLRNFSKRTQESYVRAVGQLAGFCWKSPDLVTDEELRTYFLYLKNQKRLARATTGRTRFVRFAGHYHGWLDDVLVSVEDGEPRLGALAPGSDFFFPPDASLGNDGSEEARRRDEGFELRLLEEHPLKALRALQRRCRHQG